MTLPYRQRRNSRRRARGTRHRRRHAGSGTGRIRFCTANFFDVVSRLFNRIVRELASWGRFIGYGLGHLHRNGRRLGVQRVFVILPIKRHLTNRPSHIHRLLLYGVFLYSSSFSLFAGIRARYLLSYPRFASSAVGGRRDHSYVSHFLARSMLTQKRVRIFFTVVRGGEKFFGPLSTCHLRWSPNKNGPPQ